MSAVPGGSDHELETRHVLQQTAASEGRQLSNGHQHIEQELSLSAPQDRQEPNGYQLPQLEQGWKRGVQDHNRNSQPENQTSSIAQHSEHRQPTKVSEALTHLYTVSYLVFFSLLGTLARLGLQSLTFYPGAPIAFSELWANLGGCIVMGFLAEDRKLFKDEWGFPVYDRTLRSARQNGGEERDKLGLQAAKKAHNTVKKQIPLFIGLSTGFCGSFTSFSSFIRDAFLSMSNTLPNPGSTMILARNSGYSVMALLSVIIATVAICLSGLVFGMHLAMTVESIMFSVPFYFGRKWVDPFVVFTAFGLWVGSIFLALFPPNKSWRSQAVFSVVFAPLGCLLRFYLAKHLNGKIASFPVGTYMANILGTIILGMSWDLQHVPMGGVIGCQVLQGIQDGFCGCLTTVSTWVVELTVLRKLHAYRYGLISIVTALALLIIIMGSLQWTAGFSSLLCEK